MFFSSCDHEWHQVGVVKRVAAESVGAFNEYGSVYCPYCKKFKKNIPIADVQRLIDAREVDRKCREIRKKNARSWGRIDHAD